MRDYEVVADGVFVDIRNKIFPGGNFVTRLVKMKTRNSAYFEVGVGRDGCGREDDELEQAPSATTRATTGINASELLANRFMAS